MQHPLQARPISLFCAAAPADEALLAQWEKQLLPLQQAGQVALWSERHLRAGDPREQITLEQLRRADTIILLLSADFFASLECISLMEQALKRRQDEGIKVIPLVLRVCQWQESSLGTLACLPANGMPVMEWASKDKALNACAQGLHQLLSLPSLPPALPPRSGTRSSINRERMLRRLRRSYRDLLSQSLEGITWIELGLTEKPEAVQNVTNLALRIGQQSEQPLPDGTTIVQVYEQAEQELLILGEPGAGKSTLLLHLAQHLVAQAEADETRLLPILLPLSSWAVKQATLLDWMSEQIAQTYDVPRKVSQQWVAQERVLPLLDGLDEMNEVARPACIAAINTYHRKHLTPLVVCSRRAEYEAIADKERLALQTAVVIHSLTDEQVDTALSKAGKPMAFLRTAIQTQPEWQELATTPLMLHILMLAYQGKTVKTSQLSATPLEEQIWNAYVQRMIGRRRLSERYSLEQTRTWLAWLAYQIRQHNQTIFYIERLQPDWLSSNKLFRLYHLYTGLLIGLLVGLIAGLVAAQSFGLVGGIIGGAVGGLFGGFISQERVEIKPAEVLAWSWPVMWRNLVGGLALGTGGVLGGIAGKNVGLGTGSTLTGAFAGILSSILASGLVGGGLSSRTIEDRYLLKPNQGIWLSARNSLFVTVLCGLVGALAFGLITNPSIGLLIGLAVGLAAGLINGGLACIQHLALRLLLLRANYIPLHYPRFLDYAAELLLLRRVGGGYSFVHRRLLDYFASLALATQIDNLTTQGQPTYEQNARESGLPQQGPLIAIARVNLEEADAACIEKTYTAFAGIAPNIPDDFAGVSFEVPLQQGKKAFSFDICLHTSENIELIGPWHKHLLYELRNQHSRLVEFPFQAKRVGKSFLVIDFYHERHWLSTLRFDFEAMEDTKQSIAVS